MLHSKFSLSFDIEDQMVSIYIEHKVNSERTFSSPIFYLDDNGKLIIPPNSDIGYNKSTFSYLARHVKTKIDHFKEYIEDEYLREKSYENLPF